MMQILKLKEVPKPADAADALADAAAAAAAAIITTTTRGEQILIL